MANDFTIKNICCRAVVVPLRRPVVADIGRFDTWPLVLVDLDTSGDIVGRSYIAPYRASAFGSVIAEIHDLGASLRSKSIAPFDCFQAMNKAVNVVGLAGISVIAASAIDMAIWDAKAKHAGVPLVMLLGGTIGPVQAYNSNALWREDARKLGEQAKELLGEGGFAAMKLRLGNRKLEDDLAALTAVRDAVGPEIDVMVDFNQALGLGDAIRRCHELDDKGLYWFEEPIAYDNVRGYAQLATKVRTPLQMGENYYGPRDFVTFLAADAVHYAMADLMRIGGISGWLRAASVAAAAGVQFSSHLYPEVAAHLMRVTPTAHWIEWVDWANPILAVPTEPQNGRVTASAKPGIGLEWDERAINKYAVS